MEEINNTGELLTYTGDSTSPIIHDGSGQIPLVDWQQAQPMIYNNPNQLMTWGSAGGYTNITTPTIESLQNQLEFLEGMVANLRKQLNELKGDTQKYAPRKLKKN